MTRIVARAQTLTACVVVCLFAIGALLPTSVWAQGAVDPVYEEMKDKTQIVNKLGSQVPLDATFKDAGGESVKLADLYRGERPILLSMIYFSCPSLCNIQMDGEVRVLRDLEWQPGQEFEVVVVSMDHRDDPESAAKRKAYVMENYERPDTANSWHFLTGTESEIRRVADAIGFGFEWSDEQQEYMHSAGLFVTTPTGQVSRVLKGVYYEPETLRLALNEAGDGKLGTVWDTISMWCVGWDPQTGKYSVTAWAIMRIGIILCAVLSLVVVLIARKGRKKQNGSEPSMALGIQS